MAHVYLGDFCTSMCENPTLFFFLFLTTKNIQIFIWGGGVEKKAGPILGPTGFLPHRVKEDSKTQQVFGKAQV